IGPFAQRRRRECRSPASTRRRRQPHPPNEPPLLFALLTPPPIIRACAPAPRLTKRECSAASLGRLRPKPFRSSPGECARNDCPGEKYLPPNSQSQSLH